MGVRITTLPANGSLELNGSAVNAGDLISIDDISNGLLEFIPAENENGTGYTSFEFKVNDGTVDSDAANTLTINVTAVNDAPESSDKTVTTLEDVTYTFQVSDFAFDDVDGGDVLVGVRITTLPAAGTLLLNGSAVTADDVINVSDISGGLLTFVPAENENGTGYTSFEFKVNDGTVDSDAANTMTVNVTAVNDAPESSDKTVTTLEDVTYTFQVTDFAFSDVDGGDVLVGVRITTLPANGSLELNGSAVNAGDLISIDDISNGLLEFIPAENESGTAYTSFEFKVNDGTDDAVSSNTMTIDVTAVNDAPESSDKTVTTLEDTSYFFQVTDFAYSDVEGDALVGVRITTLPANGTLELNGSAVNAGDLISIDDISNGLLEFIPAENESGTAYTSFEFKVNDGTVDSDAANTMTINVTAVNDAPESSDKTVTTLEDVTYTFQVSDFAFDDVDGGDALVRVRITTLPAAGTLLLNGSAVSADDVISVSDISGGLLTFVPVENENGTGYASFEFKVNDGTVDSDSANTMTVDVTPVNDDPTVNDIYYNADEDGSAITGFFDGNDVDSDDDVNSLTYVISPTYAGEGSVVNNDDGSFSFDPGTDFQYLASDETTVISFTYTAIDSHNGISNTGTVYVTVTGANDAVDAIDDAANVSKNGTVNIDVRDNDTDIDTIDQLTVTLIDGQAVTNPGDFVILASGAIVTLEADGTLTYNPNGIHSDLVPPNTAPDSFEYTVSDGTATDTATVNITISGSNELLTKTDQVLENITRDGLTPETIDLDNYFVDPDPGDTVTYTVEAHVFGDNPGDSLPANFWANVAISGSDLNITYTDYSSEQVRLPLVITVTAHSDDTLSPNVSSTFTLTPDPQATFDIRLIAREVESSGRDFTSFTVEVSTENLGTHKGNGRFQLTNGLQDLDYSIFLSTYDTLLDIDGNKTPGVTTDNLVSVRFIDTSNGDAIVHTIFSNGGVNGTTVDVANEILSGTWTAGEGLTSDLIDKLYAGQLAVQVVINTGNPGGTTKLGGQNITVSPEVDGVDSLPVGITTVAQGSSYVVELWISDRLAQVFANQTTETASVTAAILDMAWETAKADLIDFDFTDSSPFGLFSTYDPIDYVNGVIPNINGTTFIPGLAANGYARMGFAVFSATNVTADGAPAEFSIDPTDLIAGTDGITRDQYIDFSQITISNTTVKQVVPEEFFIQTAQSNLTVSGTITVDGQEITLLPQSGTLNSTSLSGRLNVMIDDVDNPGSIRLIDSFVEVNPSGLARPDRDGTESYTAFDLADFGLVGDQEILNVFGPFSGELSLAIRDAIAKVFSSQQNLDENGYFDISEDWILDNGVLDSLVYVDEFDDSTIESEATDGATLSFIDKVTDFPAGVPDWSHARLSGNATDGFELLIPISRRLQFTTQDGYEVVLDLVGSVTAFLDLDLVNTDEAGDTLDSAFDTELDSAVPETKVYQGIIGNNLTLNDPFNDVDMYKVYLQEGDTVRVDVDASQYRTFLDSALRLFDADGNQLAISEIDAAPDEYIFDPSIFYDSYLSYTVGAGESGYYYIGVSSYANDTYDPEQTETTNPNVFESEVGSYDLTISVGNISVNPLHGTQSVDANTTLDEGTTVDLIVVRDQTELNVFGQTEGLPQSDSWIDEWSSFWVEVYVETADAKGITDATVDLNYNTNFFTATAIEFGSAFNASGQAVIDDVTGIVTGLSGAGAFDRAGNGDKTLLARVKFESLDQDDVSIDFEDKFIGPHALGLSLSNVSVNLAHDTETTLTVGDAPETDLWAIAYDVNDDDIINYRDLIILTSIYGQNVLDADSPYVWALDADKSGKVDYRDLSLLATNYGVHKGGNREVVYPSNFLQRWYGKTTDITGESSIDQVMEEALGIWQDALGLEEPLDIQLVITDLGGTQLGEGQMTGVDEEGRPVSGIVTLDDNAAGLGWYADLDSSAFSATELEGGVAYTAEAGSAAAGHYDLLTVLLHEIGHVLGFTDTYAPFESFVQTGVGGTLTFVGSGFEATLTDDGLHLDDTVHAGDVMNATLDPGVRKLPSILDTLILQSAHEAAASGSYEILVGVNAPLMANLPLVAETPATQTSENENLPVTVITSLDELSPVVIDVTSSLLTGDEPILPVLNQFFKNLLQNQDELDLTVLEGLSEELISDLRLNGLSIVDGGKLDLSGLVDPETGDLDLAGLSEEFDADFDEVFSDWAGPIL
ncbi:Ig-like domain-containing protein [Gimesia sp.]|uniref:Ig-like domain-containing protein n=1 Tax=Gimesia sp. TaxID=2024833 RepID=UPI003A9129A2